MSPLSYAGLGSIVNQLCIGMTGAGKSEGERIDFLDAARSRKTAILYLDGKGSSVEASAADLDASGLAARGDYEELQITSAGQRVFGWRALRPSQSRDPFVRRAADELTVERFLQAAYGVREMKSGTNTPWIAKYGTAGVFVYLGLLVEFPDVPINLLLELFRFESSLRHWMLDHTAYQEFADVFRDLERRATIPRLNPTQWEIEAGAAGRLLKYLDSPVVWARCSGAFDWGEAIQQKRLILLNGKNVPREVRRFLFTMAVNEATSICWDHFNRTGQPLPLLVILEEAGADDLITPHILTMSQEGRSAGIRIHALSQSIRDFGDDDRFERLLANMHRLVCYRVTSGAERLAQALAYPTWSSHRVHHEEQITYTAGHAEVESEVVTFDHDGSRRIAKGTRLMPVQGVRVVQHFYNPQQHEAEYRQGLTSLPMGTPYRERFVADFAGVRRERVEKLPDPWPFSTDHRGQRSKLYFIKLQKALDRMRQGKPYFHLPRPWQPPRIPPAMPATPQPAAPRRSSTPTSPPRPSATQSTDPAAGLSAAEIFRGRSGGGSSTTS